MIIYKTINIINNKIYIGKDFFNNPNYLGSGILLDAAIKKYGRKNFKKEILEICKDKNELELCEIYWISKFNATDRKIGYNITEGGTGGNTYKNNSNLPEIKKKLSSARKGKTYEEIMPSQEAVNIYKEKLANATRNRLKGKSYEERYGKEKADKIKLNYSRNRLGKSYEERYGKEKAKKIKEIRRAKKSIPVEIDNQSFSSMTLAAKHFKCSYMTIKKRILSDKFPNYKFIKEY
jgi:group I intron endonuclease